MRTLSRLFAAVILAAAIASPAFAHFQMIVPSTEIVAPTDDKEISIRMMFLHPMEGHSMDMAKPAEFGVFAKGKKQDLLETLEEQLSGPTDSGSTASSNGGAAGGADRPVRRKKRIVRR